MNTLLRVRLSVMLFLQYFVWGAWYVTLGTWLATSLRFSGQQVGLAAGTTAVGAILAPFLVGILADKSTATQKVLGGLHGLGAIVLVLASYQTSFQPLYAALLVYSLCYMPTLALSNSLTFRHISDPSKEFGAIRVFGTIGWIVAGVLIGSLGLEATRVPMFIAAGSSLMLSLYCFTLPETPPLVQSGANGFNGIVLKEALGLFKDRSLKVFAIASLLICVPLQFYYAFTNLFLNEIGVTNAASKMTTGQMSEMLCMLLIPWFFRSLGVKYMLAVGMSSWVLRYLMFASGSSAANSPMLWVGIVLHGICYDFFFVSGQIYIDRKAPLELRAATQGMITVITYGMGMLLGSWVSGVVVDMYAGASGSSHSWQQIWLVAAGASAVVLVLFLFGFQDRQTNKVHEREQLSVMAKASTLAK